MNFSPLRRDCDEPLYIQIRNSPRRHIAENSGIGKLPTEHELMKIFGVSRNTVSAALALLAEENLVSRIKHRGTVITALQDIYDPQNPRRSVGMVFPESNDFWLDALQAMDELAVRGGMIVRHYIYRWNNIEEEQRCILKAMRQCAGVILYPNHGGSDRKMIERLATTHYPLVLFDLDTVAFPCNAVATDHYFGSVLLTRILIGEGRKRIAFIGAPEQRSSIRLRCDGYRAEIEGSAVDTGRELIVQFPVEGKLREFERVIGRIEPDAMIFANSLFCSAETGFFDWVRREGMIFATWDRFRRGGAFCEAIQDQRELGKNAMMLLKELLVYPGVKGRRVLIAPEVHCSGSVIDAASLQSLYSASALPSPENCAAGSSQACPDQGKIG